MIGTLSHRPVLATKVGEVEERYADVAVLTNAFYWRLHAGELTARYPYEQIDEAIADRA